MLRDDLVHLVDQVETLEGQVTVAVLEPAQVEVVVFCFRASSLSRVGHQSIGTMAMVRLRLAVQ